MSEGDYTTLSATKEWLNILTPNSDPLLERLITSASSYIDRWTNRQLPMTTRTDKLNGTRSNTITLPAWPVQKVYSVKINGSTLPLSSDGISYGYIFSDRFLHIIGGAFPVGLRNVEITYSAGYATTDAVTIPAIPYKITPDLFSTLWVNHSEVSIAGVAAERVTTTPSTGQFIVGKTGVYEFAAADTGKVATITYGTVPTAIEQACVEMVGAKFRERSRIGLSSENVSVTGQSTSFRPLDLSAEMRALLQSYRSLVPL